MPTEHSGSMWEAVDYVFKQTEPLVSYRVTSSELSPPKTGLRLSKVCGSCYNYEKYPQVVSHGHEVARYWSKPDVFCFNELYQCFDLKCQLWYDCLVFRNGIWRNWILTTLSYQRDILFYYEPVWQCKKVYCELESSSIFSEQV